MLQRLGFAELTRAAEAASTAFPRWSVGTRSEESEKSRSSSSSHASASRTRNNPGNRIKNSNYLRYLYLKIFVLFYKIYNIKTKIKSVDSAAHDFMALLKLFLDKASQF